ncbi:unnamed protein product [Brachionus calyciflorus]|uniref:RRM domain-containing protein n=1 Tax=Brachionus calyciflorus TaxID=104777 RepID=A0A813MLF7_9BILA|nr:unnamed protein product [Brachionus calyciflorus]
MIKKSEKVKAKQQEVSKKVEVKKEATPVKVQKEEKKAPTKQQQPKKVEKPVVKKEVEKPIKKEPEQPKKVEKNKNGKPAPVQPKVEKKAEKNVENKTPKQEVAKPAATPETQAKESKQKAVDSCTLFVKALPADVTEEELRSLSADIQEIRIKRTRQNLNKKNKKSASQFAFAYLEFKNEDLTNKIYKELQHKKIREKEIVVDFVGEKSSYVKKEKKEKAKEQDLLKLHIGGFDKNATEQDLKKLFKNFTEFALPTKRDTKLNHGFAFVAFANEEDAKKALEATNGKNFNGKALNVEYAFKRPEPKKKQEKAVEKTQEPANKKLKNSKGEEVAKKQEDKKQEVAKTNGKTVDLKAKDKKQEKAEEKKTNGKRKLEEEEEDDDEEEDDSDEEEGDDDEDDDEDDEEMEEDDDEDDDEEDDEEEDDEDDDEEEEDDDDDDDDEDDDDDDEDDE